MKRFFFACTIAFLLSVNVLFSGSAAAQNPTERANGKPVPDQYIIVLKEGANLTSVVAVAKVEPQEIYSSVLNGFSATLTKGQLAALSNNPNVAYIEQDMYVSVETTQSGATWGLDRIDQTAMPLSGSYTYNTTASNVTAYIIDTGLQANHPDFGGRAQNVFNAAGGSNEDCNGHGTHVGGTVGGSTYGVAKGVQLRGVKVLDCAGSGTNAGVIAGMDWVRVNAVKPAVANMSLGGGASTAVNSAATNLNNSGVFLAVAAGNSNLDACRHSPAGATGVMTVAASTNTDAKASYSNFGSCVEIYAPGSSITSAWLSGGVKTINGTSMASPHVAGVGALYKASLGDAPSSTINSWIVNNGTPNVISGNARKTPNLLLNKRGL